MGHQIPPICWQAVNGHAAVDSEIPVDKEVDTLLKTGVFF
ncbi:hypothetical protein FOXYSP1_05167 [Fusarium oxysporum f. sp. phaseoli]